LHPGQEGDHGTGHPVVMIFIALLLVFRFAQDSPLEEAVSSELVSEWHFPGYWEKYREFCSDPDASGCKGQPNQSLTT
jgi:hypothetical protein